MKETINTAFVRGGQFGRRCAVLHRNLLTSSLLGGQSRLQHSSVRCATWQQATRRGKPRKGRCLQSKMQQAYGQLQRRAVRE